LLDRAVQAINSGDQPVSLAAQTSDEPDSAEGLEMLTVLPGDAGEIRRLTILFADLVDSTELSTRLEPERYRLLVGGYREIVRRSVERYEGHIPAAKGDGLLAVFGHPCAHEDDVSRAVQAGLDIAHIPYNGGPAATQALLAGDALALFSAYVNVKELAAAGKLKILGLAEDKRSPGLPDLPTFAEQGVRGVDAPLCNAIVAPVGTPQQIVTLLNREIRLVLDKPEVRSRLAAAGMDVIGGSPEQLALLVERDSVKYARLAKELKIKAD